MNGSDHMTSKIAHTSAQHTDDMGHHKKKWLRKWSGGRNTDAKRKRTNGNNVKDVTVNEKSELYWNHYKKRLGSSVQVHREEKILNISSVENHFRNGYKCYKYNVSNVYKNEFNTIEDFLLRVKPSLMSEIVRYASGNTYHKVQICIEIVMKRINDPGSDEIHRFYLNTKLTYLNYITNDTVCDLVDNIITSLIRTYVQDTDFPGSGFSIHYINTVTFCFLINKRTLSETHLGKKKNNFTVRQL